MKKGTLTNILLTFMLIIGLSLLLYPSFSDYWNSMHQTRAIARYAEEVAHLKQEDYSKLWEEAIAYNKSLLGRTNSYVLDETQKESYRSLLSISEASPMGYIEIPSINVNLPIYHSTDEDVLQVAVGHLEWTSLPTGGESTHTALSGHRGLPSARLFTDLDQVREGDTFILNILDRVMTYEVDQILIVEPHVTEPLFIEEGKDLCTLVTCTPYGVNSHRLLVRGHRVDNAEQVRTYRITADALRVEPLLVAIILFVPILLILLIFMMIYDRTNSKKH